MENIIALCLIYKQDFVPDRFSTFYLHKGLKAYVFLNNARVHNVLHTGDCQQKLQMLRLFKFTSSTVNVQVESFALNALKKAVKL